MNILGALRHRITRKLSVGMTVRRRLFFLARMSDEPSKACRQNPARARFSFSCKVLARQPINSEHSGLPLMLGYDNPLGNILKNAFGGEALTTSS